MRGVQIFANNNAFMDLMEKVARRVVREMIKCDVRFGISMDHDSM